MAELELDLPSLSFAADDYDDLGDAPAPSTPTADGSDRSAAPAVHWHDDNSTVRPEEDSTKPTPPPAAHTTSAGAEMAPSASHPLTSALAAPSPSAPPAALSSASLATHHSRPSIIAFGPRGSTVDLSVLQLSSPDDYLRMFKAVLTLQRKCRVWRVRIKERMRAKVLEQRKRQEEEWQLKLHNIKQQRKHSQAMRQSQVAIPIPHPPSPPLDPTSSPHPSPLPPPLAPLTPAQPVWTVELPSDEGHRLQFTLCMMKVQRLFRAKLARARVRLVEKLRRDKEEQEREMRERIERRKRQRAQAAESPPPLPSPLTHPTAPPIPTLLLPTPDLPPPAPTTPLPLSTSPTAEPLRGSLTSRTRLSHLSRPAGEWGEGRRPQTAEAEVQVDAEELREAEVLRTLSTQALFVGLEGVAGAGAAVEAGVGVGVRTLADGHLQVMAGLAGLSLERRRGGVGKEGGEAGGRGWGGWTGEGEEMPFVTSVRMMGQPQYLSAALYERMFGGGRRRGKGGWDEGEEDEDWENIIHLPLPAAYAAAAAHSPMS